jgi:hypothetical protein
MSNNTTFAVTAIIAAMAMLGTVIVTIPLQQQAYAQAETFNVNERIPLDREIIDSCAGDGEGEVVHVTGRLHLLGHVTLDSAGGFHLQPHFNTQGVSGTGLTTGDSYRMIHVGANNTVNGRVGSETTDVFNFRLIGQGDASNHLVHLTLHFTVNPDGSLTAFVVNSVRECK